VSEALPITFGELPNRWITLLSPVARSALGVNKINDHHRRFADMIVQLGFSLSDLWHTNRESKLKRRSCIAKCFWWLRLRGCPTRHSGPKCCATDLRRY